MISSGGTTYYRCYAKDGGDFLFSSKEWYVKDARKNKDSNIIEDDIVTMYGTFTGLTTITRAINNTDASVLGMDAKYILFKGESVDVSNAELVSEAELLSAIIANPLSMSKGNSNYYSLNFSNPSISNFVYDKPSYTESGGLEYNVEFAYKAKYASLDVYAKVSYKGANGAWILVSVQYTDILFSTIDANGHYEYDDYNGVKELDIHDFNNSTLTGTLEDRYGSSTATVEYGVDYGFGYLYIKGDYFSERFNIETGEFNNYKRVSGSSSNNSDSIETASDEKHLTADEVGDSIYQEHKDWIGKWRQEYNDNWVSIELYEKISSDGSCGRITGSLDGKDIDAGFLLDSYGDFEFTGPGTEGHDIKWGLYMNTPDELTLVDMEYYEPWYFVR